MIAEEEYEGMLETIHLLKSPSNAQRLAAAIAQLDAGGGTERDPIE